MPLGKGCALLGVEGFPGDRFDHRGDEGVSFVNGLVAGFNEGGAFDEEIFGFVARDSMHSEVDVQRQRSAGPTQESTPLSLKSNGCAGYAFAA